MEGSLLSKSPKSKPALLPLDPKIIPILAEYPIVLNLANNHILDYGLNGLTELTAICLHYSIPFVGISLHSRCYDGSFLHVGVNAAGTDIYIVSLGWSHEDCLPPTYNSVGVHDFTYQNFKNIYNIISAQSSNALVYLYVHAGYEFEHYPIPLHVELARSAIDIGYESVLFSHAHVPQAFEIYNFKYIYYGLGNFCFISNSISHPPSSLKSLIVNFNLLCDQSIPSTELLSHQYHNCCFNSITDPQLPVVPHDLYFYSKQYPYIRSRFINPRPVLYPRSPVYNSIVYFLWYYIVFLLGLLRLRPLVKLLLRWN